MIGGGIFATLGLSLVLADGAAPVAFAFAGLVALLTSYSYAKLSARYPSVGGTIEFIVKAYGDGLLAGSLNMLLLASYIVMIALYTHAFAAYGASMLPPSMYWAAYTLLAVLAIGSLTFVNFLGAVISGRLELGLVVFKLAVLLFVAAVGMALVDWTRLSPSHWPPVVNIVAGGMIIFLAYEGFELIANTAGDAKDTSILRKAYYSSVATVIAVYVLIALVSAGALSPETVLKAKDYALAVLVKPVLGDPGVALVVAAALASTSSAINATLYGTARISYLVAKYGEAPRILAKRVWRGAYEGLLFISTASLALALGASLEAISAAGSAGFLIVFTAVNLAAYRLRRSVEANPAATLTGAALSAAALAILLARMYQIDPGQLVVLAVIVSSSATAEALYRWAAKRRLAETIDPWLRERERLLREWEQLARKTAETITSILRDVEVYLIGSHARGEYEKADDIDILVVSKKPLPREKLEEIARHLEKELRLPPSHPLHIHHTTRDRLGEYRHRKKLGEEKGKEK